MKKYIQAIAVVTIFFGFQTCAPASDYPYYGYYDQQYYDNQQRIDDQRLLQEEFLDQQFSNSLHLDNLRQWRRETEQRERDKRW